MTGEDQSILRFPADGRQRISTLSHVLVKLSPEVEVVRPRHQDTNTPLHFTTATALA